MTLPDRHAAPSICGRARFLGPVTLCLFLVAGCASSLLPKPAQPPALFVLDDAARSNGSTTSTVTNAPTLMVTTPRAVAGFDSDRIVYRRHPNELESFANHQWVDTPARMLAPLLVRALERTGAFRAVFDSAASAAPNLRLDSEIVRLQQDFTDSPSRVRLTLRVVLVDATNRRTIAARTFDASQAAVRDDPRGGVDAANQVVARVLAEVAAFCVESGAAPR